MTNKTTLDPKEIIKFSKLVDHWWNKDGAFKTLHDINPTRLEFINEYLPLSDKTILDLGCGGGILAESMAVQNALVTGIDADSQGIASATKHASYHQLPINYLCDVVENYDAFTFHGITCMEMLEHVENPQLVINHCARLLKPSGFLFLSTINRTLTAYLSAIIAAEYILDLLPRQTHDYAKFIKPSELAFMVRNAGLTVVGLRGLSYNPINRSAWLCNSVSVNYLMACLKP